MGVLTKIISSIASIKTKYCALCFNLEALCKYMSPTPVWQKYWHKQDMNWRRPFTFLDMYVMKNTIVRPREKGSIISNRAQWNKQSTKLHEHTYMGKENQNMVLTCAMWNFGFSNGFGIKKLHSETQIIQGTINIFNYLLSCICTQTYHNKKKKSNYHKNTQA